MTLENDEEKFKLIKFIYGSFHHQYPLQENSKLSYINDTKDAVLRNVALALTEYYEIGGNLFYNSYKGDEHLCENLNKWLNEQKLLYTSGGMCEKNNDLWNDYIETKVWDILKEKNIMEIIEDKDPKYHKHWCKRSKYEDEIEFHSYWIPDTCKKEQNKKCVCSCDNKEVSKENGCQHPPCDPLVATRDYSTVGSREGPGPASLEVQPESPPSSRSGIAPSMGYILFAVTIFCIILCKFTPLRSLLSKITGRKKRQWDNHMNELAKNFSENYLNNGDSNNHDRMNNMFYQSIRN
ncbi:hypothetical protein, conserved [Plasmodium vivax]|nr:hypothetical protein, conserved [Plasmodium vivax]